MLRTMTILKGSIAVMLFSTTLAFADSGDSSNWRLDPNNPNCSPGVKGCTANYPTSEITKNDPSNQALDPSNPNCSPGVKGCTANYPTSDTAKQGMAKQKEK